MPRENLAHAERAQLVRERLEFRARPDLGIELVVVANVVAMRAAGRCLENRRGVNVADSEFVKIPRDRAGIVEREPLIELQAVGRGRDRR